MTTITTTPIATSTPTSTSTPKYYLIPLESILKRDTKSIIYITHAMKKRGFVFVKLPDELVKQVDLVTKIMENFFSNTTEYKEKFKKKPIFGYFGVDHKESFRLLTRTRMNEQSYPDTFDEVKKLVNQIDRIMYAISMRLAPVLFPNLSESARKVNIPFFRSNKPWGMFDFARYFNDGKKQGLSCEEHYDPGLLSFSIRSTEEGLELKDEFNKWVRVPSDKNVAVLWAGKAANDINPQITPGVHRVKCDNNGKPRMSMWHEICTEAQEHKELTKDEKQTIASIYESSSGIPFSKSPGIAYFKSLAKPGI